jgi:serine phosphatase RsbU (regulator of sigma subunit)
LWPELEYEGEELDTIQNRPLFLYTDGLTEAENCSREQFGDERLLHMLRDTRYENARQVIETLAEKVAQHRGDAEPNDDLTMLCLRIS